MSTEPLIGLRYWFLRACVAIAAAETTPATLTEKLTTVDGAESSWRVRAFRIVYAFMSDERRSCTFLSDGEDAWSLGGVFCSRVFRFLSGGIRGDGRRTFPAPNAAGACHSTVVFSLDGASLLASFSDDARRIVQLSIVDGSVIRELDVSRARQWFRYALSISADGFIFVAEYVRNRVQVLSPDLLQRTFIGTDYLKGPSGVVANRDIIAVSEAFGHRVSVFSRLDGGLVTRFGRHGDGTLGWPRSLCFMYADSHIAVADHDRVCVFSLSGRFVRHIGVGLLRRAYSVACSAADELVVADGDCLRLFSDTGVLLRTFGCVVAPVSRHSVCVRGSTIAACDTSNQITIFHL